jgi:hypothetical protein
MYVYVSMNMYVCICMYVYVCMYVCMHACMYVCMDVYMYVCHTHTYTHTHTQLVPALSEGSEDLCMSVTSSNIGNWRGAEWKTICVLSMVSKAYAEYACEALSLQGMCVCIYVCIYVCMYVCMYVYMHVCRTCF